MIVDFGRGNLVWRCGALNRAPIGYRHFKVVGR